MASGISCGSEGRARRPDGAATARRMPSARRTTKEAFGPALAHQGCTAAWAFDEGRFGLKVWFQRRWYPFTVRPPWLVADRYEWRWLYVAVEPRTGQSFCLLLPTVDRACLQGFLDAFADHVAGQRVGLMLDGSGAHVAKALVWPESVVPLPLPPYSPELNPVELVFRHLRARLSNRIFADVPALEAALTTVLQDFWEEPARLQQLTGFDWWLRGLDDIASLAS
jgi:transposase